MAREVVITSGARSPIGTFGGTLMNIPGPDLAAMVVKETIKRSKIDPGLIEDVIFGNCMMRPDEYTVGRLVGLKAGIPFQTPGVTIQRQCASGMQAVVYGAQQIMLGDAECILAGGVESMSRAIYYSKDARWGARLKHTELSCGIWDGLTDSYCGLIMGLTAENLAAKHNISRQEQDEVSLRSHNNAEAAIKGGRFKDEILPIPIKQKKGDPKMFDTDEHVRMGMTMDMLNKLKPTFKEGGTVTAGNSSGINDGAAAVVLMSRDKAKELGITPIAKLVSYAAAGVEPELMGYGPVPATQKALKKANLKLSDIELIEVNEAFAAQYMACEKLLGLKRDIVNVNGSGIALGHPVGCTGTRIIISLLNEMKRRGNKLGLATLCVGGGMGMTSIWEMI
jgi:acetyl-CoA C-acetyltransferase